MSHTGIRLVSISVTLNLEHMRIRSPTRAISAVAELLVLNCVNYVLKTTFPTLLYNRVTGSQNEHSPYTAMTGFWYCGCLAS